MAQTSLVKYSRAWTLQKIGAPKRNRAPFDEQDMMRAMWTAVSLTKQKQYFCYEDFGDPYHVRSYTRVIKLMQDAGLVAKTRQFVGLQWNVARDPTDADAKHLMKLWTDQNIRTRQTRHRAVASNKVASTVSMPVSSEFADPIQILDHGYVRYIDHMGSDLSIVRNARVSYDAAWRTGENEKSDARLINYLMANGHNTPFESCTITFEVKAPIFVLRQWHRHRTQSYNELSARYRELPEEFYVPVAEQITEQSTDNKQMRTDQVIQHAEAARDIIRHQNEAAFRQYKALIQLGVPRELARTVLPVGTYSHMFATMNLHNLFHFLKERLHPHAQYEIKVYAQAMLGIIKEKYPVATAAFIATLPDTYELV